MLAKGRPALRTPVLGLGSLVENQDGWYHGHMRRLDRVISLAALLVGLSACATPAGAPAGERLREGEHVTVAETLPGDPLLGSEPGVQPLQRVARNRLGPVRSCYAVGLRKNPNLTGRVVLRFTVRPDGLLEQVHVVEDQLQGSGVADCIRSRVGGWRTPFRPKEGVTVEYPFDFTPLH